MTEREPQNYRRCTRHARTRILNAEILHDTRQLLMDCSESGICQMLATYLGDF